MKIEKRGIVNHTLTLTGKDIIEMLQTYSADVAPSKDVKIIFRVPGGGDWSGQDIDIMNDSGIILTWTREVS